MSRDKAILRLYRMRNKLSLISLGEVNRVAGESLEVSTLRLSSAFRDLVRESVKAFHIGKLADLFVR